MIVQMEGRETPGRVRAWVAHFLDRPGHGTVITRHYVDDLADGEDLNDNPDTHELSWAEWEQAHADYGLELDGTPLEV